MIYLHIGIHKTGSTSLQDFLQKRAADLVGCGLHMFTGAIFSSNHIELSYPPKIVQ